ncbi:MAG: (deoxy)nucleoside triphosphate pyrophosphohydrolase [Ancrocorticia sp.]|uniref:(deoxy)nucleoside triphosphate pyrophosphohydrolase n=1 Tax=Ancrocorticia sp. TaxID=2593684 RepID=UPI003F8DCB26
MAVQHEKKQIDVVGAVITDQSNVFCARRSEKMSLPGKWEFPGGKIEQGETPRQALQRELEEELLIEVEIGDEVTTTEFEYDFGSVSLTTFYCHMREVEPLVTEHAEIRWVPAAELRTLDWAPADQPAVEIVQRDLMR